jgi:polyisoprenoid-binding protein YceI
MSKQLWVMDPAHSEVTFKVRHMMITNVTGTFEISTGSMHADSPDFSDAEISFEADPGKPIKLIQDASSD